MVKRIADRVQREPSPVVTALKDRREELGLSQASLAEEVGIDPSTISLMENGWTEPNLATVEAMATAMGMRLALTFYGQNW